LKGFLTSNLNILDFVGDFDDDSLRRHLAAFFKLKNQGYDHLELNFAKLTRAMTPQLLPLAVYARSLLHEGFEVRLILPEDDKLKRLFENTNWAYLIDPRSFPKTQIDSTSHLPAFLYTNPTEQYEVVSKTVQLVLKSLNITDRKQIQAVEWSVNEVVDNVLNHAKSPIGGAMQVTVREGQQIIEFVVADAGLGIPKTLRESHLKLTSDVEALDAAIREGVTRNNTTNMGNGLFGTFRLAELSNGKFGLYSGYASLSYSSNGLHSKAEAIPFGGTVVSCSINISNPELLSQALTFKGQPYTPFSLVDMANDESEKVIKLVDEVQSFGSRPAAKPVRIMIENYLNTTGLRIVVDLEDVALVTSSFADEVFGKLFVQLGPMTFMNRISLIGGSKIVRQLIDRAISQRVAVGLTGDVR
jgi:anti-sigma regulatory factor (Ser/Thr protein kinase)